jgi:hypothetical protein
VSQHIVQGQQTLNANLKYERGRPAAVAAARSLVMPGCRIFFKTPTLASAQSCLKVRVKRDSTGRAVKLK